MSNYFNIKMRKKLYPLLVIAALNLTACTEVLEPNIDYGGNTYINDYTALVKAVNDLQKSLEERFDALNTLLKNGMAEIKLAIDENTGAIKILTSTTENGLGEINTSLFNGFEALNSQIKATGESIIFAINQNGELLRLKIDENGKLLETTLLANNAALIKCINDNSKSLDERFAALTAAVEAGFKNVVVSIDKTTGAITLLDKNTNSSLDKINTSLTDGFKAINEHIDSNGNTIVEAMNKNNELLTISIDKNGNLIEAAIKGQTDALVAAINDQTKAINERIAALNTLIEIGLKNIELKIDANTGAITLLDKNLGTSMGKLDTSLGTINTNLLNGFANLNTQLVNIDKSITGLSGNVAKIETAINKQGELIVNKLDAQNKLLETTVVGSLDEISASIKSQTTSMEEKIGALNTLIDAGLVKMETTNTNLGTIGGQIKDLNTSMTTVNGNLSAINGSVGSVQSTLNDMGGSITSLAGKMETGFTNVSKAVEANGTTVVKAINQNGEQMTTIFGQNGEKLTAISTDIQTLTGNLNDNENGLPAMLRAQKALDDAITNPSTGLTAIEKENSAHLQALLTSMLKDSGVYTSKNDNTYMFMEPSLWASIEAAGKNSNIYAAFAEMIDGSVPNINCTQVTPGSWHTCAKFTPTKTTEQLKAGAELVAGKPEVSSEANGKQVVRIVKVVKEDIEYTVDVSSCTYDKMYVIRVYDARGDYQIYGSQIGSRSSNPSTSVPSTQSSKVKVILRPYYNGNICINIRAFAFSYVNSNELPSLFWASDKMSSARKK